MTPTCAPSSSQAYKALTDEVSRENFKKYGHPDGPQAMTGEHGVHWAVGRLPGSGFACASLPTCKLPDPRYCLPLHAPLHSAIPTALLSAVSVALPEWFFSKDKQTAPLVLLVLLFGGIVTPLGVAAWYLMRKQK